MTSKLLRLVLGMSILFPVVCSPLAAESSSVPVQGFKRVTFWYVQPEMTDAQIEAQANALAASGIDGVLIGGGRHHYLFDDLPYIEDYGQAAKKVVDACHKRGIKVAEHHSVVLTSREDYAKEHASWIQRDFETGEFSVWPEYSTWAFCPNNPDFREHYWKITKDLVQRIGVDALMSDDTVFHHGCCCGSCAKRWQAEVGGDIRQAYKDSRVAGTHEWRQFNEARRRWYEDFRQWVRERQAKELLGVTCISLIGNIASAWGTQNHGGFVEGGLNTADAAVWEIYNPADFYSWRRNAAEASALAEACRVRRVIPLCLPYADIAEKPNQFDPEEETFMWALSKAYGMPFLLGRVYLTGLVADDTPRSYYLFERDKLTPYLKAEPAAAVGVFFSRRSRDVDPVGDGSHSQAAIAWAEALMDNLVPYRAVTEETLDSGLPKNLHTLIMPNVFSISDRNLDAIEKFVKGGGIMITTFQTGICDESGEPALNKRQERLARLFGVKLLSEKRKEIPAEAKYPRADVDVDTLKPLGGVLEAYQHKLGKGEVIYMPELAELAAFQDQANEGDIYQDRREPKITSALAKLVQDMTPDQPLKITSSDPNSHLLTTVQKSGKRLLVHIINCSGADLRLGRRIPKPSKVTWGPEVTLTVELQKNTKSAKLLSLDEKDNLTIDQPGKRFELRSPKRYGLLVIEE